VTNAAPDERFKRNGRKECDGLGIVFWTVTSIERCGKCRRYRTDEEAASFVVLVLERSIL
jgi:hypothetical protein